MTSPRQKKVKKPKLHVVHHQCGWCGEVTIHECKEKGKVLAIHI